MIKQNRPSTTTPARPPERIIVGAGEILIETIIHGGGLSKAATSLAALCATQAAFGYRFRQVIVINSGEMLVVFEKLT
jgi:hypothetical protein